MSTKRSADVALGGAGAGAGDESKLDSSTKKARHTEGSKDAVASKAGKKEFLAVYRRVCDELLAELAPRYEMPTEAVDYIREMMDYTVPGGKLNRGLTVVHSLQLILGSKSMTADQRYKASVLGWCIEWLQACFLVADDVMDASTTRRGRPCWYKLDKVRLNAVNDSFILRSCVSWLLEKTFGTADCYVPLVELFRETTLQTELGQLLDLTSAPADGTVDLSRFSVDRYNKIVKYKTAFYSFYLPVACAMIVGGIASKPALAEACSILVDMGTYFQIQDDVLDCFGAPEVIGKIGTDIQDNKCGWLVVQALAVATEEQRSLLKENYGKWDDKCVAKVKALYTTLNLQAKFDQLEADSHASLVKRIAGATYVPSAVYDALLAKIYKRAK